MDTFLTHSLPVFIFPKLSKIVNKPKTNKNHGSVILMATYMKRQLKRASWQIPKITLMNMALHIQYHI